MIGPADVDEFATSRLRPADPGRVGPYRVLRLLGSGGMGKVYLGRSPGGRAVAIKVIRPELAEKHGFRVRFAREVAAARGVSGVFTAAVVDADPDADTPWMATAYVDGPSLADAVEENGPLPPEAVLSLAAGLAEGLQAIHRAGLVHRDLKPSNVLLASDGPRVIDFGISWAGEGLRLTDAGAVVGSPGFVSPEQARGREVVPASDVFSLGAVLVYAATGDGPFGDGPTQALMYRVVHEPPDLSGLPPSLRHLIEACLEKEPGFRPTVEQLLDRLADCVPADPVASGPATGDRLAAGSLSGERASWDPWSTVGDRAAGAFDDETRVEAAAGGWGDHGDPSWPSQPPAARRWWPLAVLAACVLVAAAVMVPMALASHGSPQPQPAPPGYPSVGTSAPGVTRGTGPAATASPTPGSVTTAPPSPVATATSSPPPASSTTVPARTSPAGSTSATHPAAPPPTTPTGSRTPTRTPTPPASTTTSPPACPLICLGASR